MASISSLVPSLQISLTYKAVFLYPLSNQRPNDDAVITPSDSTSVVRGTVLVNLPRDQSITALYVTLTGTCKLPGDAALKLSKEENATMELMREDLILPEYQSLLAAGDHSFDFAFHLPGSIEIAQYSSHGYIEHNFRAFLELDQSSDTGVLSVITPPIVSSPDEVVWLIALPNDVGDAPEPFNLTVEHHSQFLGPIRLEFLSPYLTLSALAHLRLNIVGPPQPVSLLGVRAYIIQTMTVRYSASQSNAPTQIVESFNLFPVDDSAKPPTIVGDGFGNVMVKERIELQQGESRRFEELVQVPRCDAELAVSTFTSKGTIVVKHKVVVQIRYGVKGFPREKLVTIEKPVILASCICIEDSIHLPPYTKTAPDTPLKDTGNRPHGYCMCLCDYSLEELVGFWGESLKGRPSEAPEEGLERTVTVKEHRVDTEVDEEG